MTILLIDRGGIILRILLGYLQTTIQYDVVMFGLHGSLLIETSLLQRVVSQRRYYYFVSPLLLKSSIESCSTNINQAFDGYIDYYLSTLYQTIAPYTSSYY
jgi:hypothetical protein